MDLDFGQSYVLGGVADAGDVELEGGGGDGAEGDGVAGAVVGEGADGNAGAVGKGEVAAGDLVVEVGPVVEDDGVEGLGRWPGQQKPAAGPTADCRPFGG